MDKGDIKIDGKSIYDIKLDSLRKNIGIVQQEVFLYTGTIKENIKYGNKMQVTMKLWKLRKRLIFMNL